MDKQHKKFFILQIYSAHLNKYMLYDKINIRGIFLCLFTETIEKEETIMLKKIIRCDKKVTDLKERCRELSSELSALQLEIGVMKRPVILIFEGWEASGKGSVISSVIRYLDPRFFKVISVMPATSEEKRYPFLKRYWRDIPEKGRISVMNKSWYSELADSFLEGEISEEEYDKRIVSVRNFERQLYDDGYIIIKFFLHIDSEEQKKRLKKLSENKKTRWRVTEKDRIQNKNYNKYLRTFKDMLSITDFPFAGWNIIDAQSRLFTKYAVFSTITEKIKNSLETFKPAVSCSSGYTLIEMPLLSEVELQGKTVSPERYPELLKKYQKKLSEIHNQIYRKGIPLILCFEGWDAAGKGGAIKRVSAALDPRGYEAVPISAPDKTELAHHYLWRFWNRIPKKGHIAIFDRTWYGRVMVEKIEGFTETERCNAAFAEINEFEYELSSSGAVIIKFWLHIDSDEQLNRFTLRQNTPEKQWKITDEDWRNREKREQYEEAVNEMLARTSTSFAPWHIIEANDKLYARLKIINTIIRTVSKYI